MRIPYTTCGVLVLLLGSAAAGYGARQPKSGAGGSSASSTTSASTSKASTAKVAPKKSSAARAHATRTSAKRRVTHPALAHLQVAPAPARISEIQSALSREGAYQGEPSGKWDAATVDAMRQFQSDHGLTASGKIDALTLQKLGLGSQVSGMGAPVPVAVPQASAADGGDQTEHP